MAFETGTDYPESDADDEYERSIHDSSPTIYEKAISSDHLPETIITEWTPEECADFVGSLGLRQYADQFLGIHHFLHDIWPKLTSSNRERDRW
mgnify:CR=1 FL=1